MTKYLDRNLKGIGRLKKAFGTDDPTTVAGIRVMVDQLYKSGDWDILKGVVEGKVTLLQVYTKWKNQDLKNVTVTSTLMFHPTAFDWLEGYKDINERTRTGYRNDLNQLYKVKGNFPLDDIGEVMSQYRKKSQKRGIGRSYNKVRMTVRAFLKDYFNQFHPLYQDVVMVKPLPQVRQRPIGAHTVAEVATMLTKLPRADIGDQFWTMCLTGIGMEEYRNGLKVEGNGIRVLGKKMAHKDDRRNRLVPHVEDPHPMVIQEKRFRNHINKASKGRIQLYDARRCFARWCLEAGIPFDRVQQYMGHAPVSMTAMYARGMVDQHLVNDAELLRTYIEKHRTVTVNPNAHQFFG
jgi:integrase